MLNSGDEKAFYEVVIIAAETVQIRFENYRCLRDRGGECGPDCGIAETY
jgi:hypothetical protein